jgi:hypothetical protein
VDLILESVFVDVEVFAIFLPNVYIMVKINSWIVFKFLTFIRVLKPLRHSFDHSVEANIHSLGCIANATSSLSH